MLVSGTIAAPLMRHRDLGIVEESDGPRCMKRRGVPGRTRLRPGSESANESVNSRMEGSVLCSRRRAGRGASDGQEDLNSPRFRSASTNRDSFTVRVHTAVAFGSKGMRQKVGIAIAKRAKALLLDTQPPASIQRHRTTFRSYYSE